MLLGNVIDKFRRADTKEILKRLDAIEEKNRAIEEKLADIERGGTYVNEDGEKVPMSQVINEYLYGAKEGDA